MFSQIEPQSPDICGMESYLFCQIEPQSPDVFRMEGYVFSQIDAEMVTAVVNNAS